MCIKGRRDDPFKLPLCVSSYTKCCWCLYLVRKPPAINGFNSRSQLLVSSYMDSWDESNNPCCNLVEMWWTFNLPQNQRGDRGMSHWSPFIRFDHVALTELHQQRQQDPQGDLEGLSDMVVVEGEDRESLPVGSGGVALVVVVVLPISRRRVISHSRSSGATRRRDGDEEEQQQRKKPRQDRQAGTGAAPQQHSHVCRRSVGTSDELGS